MKPSILLGAIDNLSWNDICSWVKSIREVGFSDEVWIIGYRGITDEIKEHLKTYNINLYEVNHTPFQHNIEHNVGNSPTRSHNMRFYHFWELLTRLNTENYKWCIATDVRVVIFQRNPVEYLDSHLQEMQFIAPSEGLTYENEEWGKDNMLRGHGPIIYDLEAKKNQIYNVGTIAGDARLMKWLFHTIYSMTEGRYYPSDQSNFGLLVNGLLSKYSVKTSLDDGWAAQLGTTSDPTKSHLWPRLNENRPLIKDNKVYTSNNELYYLVHQYDRVPQLKQSIQINYLEIGFPACGKLDNNKMCRKPQNHIDECAFI